MQTIKNRKQVPPKQVTAQIMKQYASTTKIPNENCISFAKRILKLDFDFTHSDIAVLIAAFVKLDPNRNRNELWFSTIWCNKLRGKHSSKRPIFHDIVDYHLSNNQPHELFTFKSTISTKTEDPLKTYNNLCKLHSKLSQTPHIPVIQCDSEYVERTRKPYRFVVKDYAELCKRISIIIDFISKYGEEIVVDTSTKQIDFPDEMIEASQLKSRFSRAIESVYPTYIHNDKQFVKKYSNRLYPKSVTIRTEDLKAEGFLYELDLSKCFLTTILTHTLPQQQITNHLIIQLYSEIAEQTYNIIPETTLKFIINCKIGNIRSNCLITKKEVKENKLTIEQINDLWKQRNEVLNKSISFGWLCMLISQYQKHCKKLHKHLPTSSATHYELTKYEATAMTGVYETLYKYGITCMPRHDGCRLNEIEARKLTPEIIEEINNVAETLSGINFSIRLKMDEENK